MVLASCPSCDGLVRLAAPYLGQQVECPECHQLLKVVALEPLALTYALDSDEEVVFGESEPG
jgi:lysine biosynthesis protein LysW